MWLKNDNRKLWAWLALCLSVVVARGDLETNEFGHIYIRGNVISTNPAQQGFWRNTNQTSPGIRTAISAGTNVVLQDQGTNLIINVSSGSDTGITNIINSFGTGAKQATNYALAVASSNAAAGLAFVTTNGSTITVHVGTNDVAGGGAGLTNTLGSAASNGSSLVGPTNQPELQVKTIVAGYGMSNVVTTTNLTLSVDNSVFPDLVYADATYVPQTRTLTAGFGLLGGGNLTADRTFELNTNVVATTNNLVSWDPVVTSIVSQVTGLGYTNNGHVYWHTGTVSAAGGGVTFQRLEHAFRGSDLQPYAVSNFWGKVETKIDATVIASAAGFGTAYSNSVQRGILIAHIPVSGLRTNVDATFLQIDYFLFGNNTNSFCDCKLYAQQTNAANVVTNSLLVYTNASLFGAVAVGAYTNYIVPSSALFTTNLLEHVLYLTCQSQASHPLTNNGVVFIGGKKGF